MRKRLALLLVTAVIGVLATAFWHRGGPEQQARVRLKRLEYWQRVQLGKPARKDRLRLEAWTGLWGGRLEPQKEVDNEYDALVSLGYMVRRSFPLSQRMTNSAAIASLAERIRAAPFSDMHWLWQRSTNGIDAVVCAADVPIWEELIRKWESEGYVPPKRDGSTNGSLSLGR